MALLEGQNTTTQDSTDWLGFFEGASKVISSYYDAQSAKERQQARVEQAQIQNAVPIPNAVEKGSLTINQNTLLVAGVGALAAFFVLKGLD